MANIFKALSNPQRLRIFLKLSNCCSDGSLKQCVGELGEDMNLAASTVSHHIKELKHSGLLHVERRGQKMECWICENVLTLMAAFISGNERQVQTLKGGCCELGQ